MHQQNYNYVNRYLSLFVFYIYKSQLYSKSAIIFLIALLVIALQRTLREICAIRHQSNLKRKESHAILSQSISRSNQSVTCNYVHMQVSAYIVTSYAA